MQPLTFVGQFRLLSTICHCLGRLKWSLIVRLLGCRHYKFANIQNECHIFIRKDTMFFVTVKLYILFDLATQTHSIVWFHGDWLVPQCNKKRNSVPPRQLLWEYVIVDVAQLIHFQSLGYENPGTSVRYRRFLSPTMTSSGWESVTESTQDVQSHWSKADLYVPF
jgi:hypothetical protein